MKAITLFKGEKAWLATTTVDGKPDPELVDLFGTATLPTAWTSDAHQHDVWRDIQRLNKGAVVVVREGGAPIESGKAGTVDPTTIKPGMRLVYNDGRAGHVNAECEVVSVIETAMAVQFADRADTTCIRFSDPAWMKFLAVSGKEGAR